MDPVGIRTVAEPGFAFPGGYVSAGADIVRRMISVGDKVRIGEAGVSIFIVQEVDPDEGRAVIEAAEERPGRYPFSMPLGALVRDES